MTVVFPPVIFYLLYYLYSYNNYYLISMVVSVNNRSLCSDILIFILICILRLGWTLGLLLCDIYLRAILLSVQIVIILRTLYSDYYFKVESLV